MTNINWYIEGPEFGACNCAFGCPCQFEALPTDGTCHGFEVIRIDKGHFGEVDLSGLNVAMVYAWPGPIFEGKGEVQAIIDERASEAQRQALETVLHGGETEEEATHWWVFCAMSDTIHETLYKPIDFEVDIDARTARVRVGDVLQSTGTPIIPPYGGGAHRVRIDIPNGIEFELAEMGAGSVTTSGGAIALDIDSKYGQFNMLRHSGAGVAH